MIEAAQFPLHFVVVEVMPAIPGGDIVVGITMYRLANSVWDARVQTKRPVGIEHELGQ